MEKFLSCDWGTSTFRLRLVEAVACKVITAEKNQRGIADTYASWKQSNKNPETRVAYYLSVIKESISKFEKEILVSLDDVPVIISGMASASIGMMELPYAMLPFSIDGSGLLVHALPAVEDFKHPVFLISGARDEQDVMRGEETQLIGAAQNASIEKQLFIFPGTHSKHITVTNRQVVAVKTFMTGEFFQLLSKKSVLAHSIEESEWHSLSSNKNSFEKGVTDGLSSNILHQSFLVRTSDLFKTATKQENYYYLSGLLIGTELNGLKKNDFTLVTLVSDELMFELYSFALKIAGIINVAFCNVDESILKGHQIIVNNLQMTQR